MASIQPITRCAEHGKGPKTDAWWEQVVDIQVVGRGVRRMQGLEHLIGLKNASFAHNQISHIQALDACTALQELSFEASDPACTHSVHMTASPHARGQPC